jgi:hypothetical protein
VFTQTTTDKEGRPVRDPDSTSYVGAIENAHEFGDRLYTEAWRRSWSRAEKKVVIADGAVWIWKSTLSGSDPDRRSLSRPPASLEAFGQALSCRGKGSQTLDGSRAQPARPG